MALGSTQPLTEISTRSISWGKCGRCVRLTTYHHPVPLSRNLGTLTSWNPLGPSGPVMELLYFYLYLPHTKQAAFSLHDQSIVTVRENTTHLLSDHYKTHTHPVRVKLSFWITICSGIYSYHWYLKLTEDFRKLHKEKHLICTLHIILSNDERIDWWVVQHAWYTKNLQVRDFLVMKHEGNRLRWRPKHRWMDDIKIHIKR